MKASGHDAPGDNGPGTVVGIDPHKRSLSATVLDECGGVLGREHFNVSGNGHRALEEWALGFGPVMRWGVEGASGVGRHTSSFLCMRGDSDSAEAARPGWPGRCRQGSRDCRAPAPTERSPATGQTAPF